MTQVDGELVNALNTNRAQTDREAADTILGVWTMQNGLGVSGAVINNIQALMNSNRLATGADETNNTIARLYAGVPTGTIVDLDDHRESLVRLAKLFFQTAGQGGHIHDGTEGQAPLVSAQDIKEVRLKGHVTQGVDLSTVTGTSVVVTTELTGKNPSTNDTTLGVVVNAPQNKVLLRHAGGPTSDDRFEDSNGDFVFGRLTEAGGVWTLSFFVDQAGVEVAHNFTGAVDIRWYFQELFDPLKTNSPVYSEFANTPSDNATADVISATALLEGKKTLGRIDRNDIANGVDFHLVTFSNVMPNTNYGISVTIENLTDVDPISLLVVVTDRTVSGFTATFNAPTDTANYKLNYLVDKDS